MVNKVMLIGNVGQDPEVKATQAGGKIASFSLATTESWKDKQTGERKTNSTWHRVVVFNPNLADVVERYLKKGAKVYVEGALSYRKYTDKSGVEKSTTEIVISNFKGELSILTSETANTQASGFVKKTTSRVAVSSEDLDDEIPF